MDAFKASLYVGEALFRRQVEYLHAAECNVPQNLQSQRRLSDSGFTGDQVYASTNKPVTDCFTQPG
jgi:hypothetical protein